MADGSRRGCFFWAGPSGGALGLRCADSEPSIGLLSSHPQG